MQVLWIGATYIRVLTVRQYPGHYVGTPWHAPSGLCHHDGAEPCWLGYSFPVIKHISQCISRQQPGRVVGNPLVSLLLSGSFSKGDNALCAADVPSSCVAQSQRWKNIEIANILLCFSNEFIVIRVKPKTVLGPCLLTWFNFNPSMDKKLHPLRIVEWIYLFILILQRFN